MKRNIPLHSDSKYLHVLPFFLNIKNRSDLSHIWNLYHLKTLRTSGRGGKGHVVGGINRGWNRKGRW